MMMVIFLSFQEDIVSTSYLAAEYLHNLGFNKKVYVIGTEGVCKELDRFGIRHTDIGVSWFNHLHTQVG